MNIAKALKKRFLQSAYRKVLRSKILEDISFCFTGDFKDYLLSGDALAKIDVLQEGLDSTSQSHINAFLKRMQNFPSQDYCGMVYGALDKIIESEGLGYNETEISEYINRVVKKQFNVSQYPIETFYFDHGLKFLDKEILQYMIGGDFLDCGAYIGDSALTLLKYQPKKIYSFEISQRFLGEYRNNMAQNRVATTQAEVFHNGTAQENKTITFNDTNSAGNNISQPGTATVDLVTIDSFVQKHSLTPSLLKMDVEGEEINTVQGAKDTIHKFRPIISAAIYHNPQQFFELKPLLESWGLNYTFIIRSLRPRVIPMEMTLLAYPPSASATKS